MGGVRGVEIRTGEFPPFNFIQRFVRVRPRNHIQQPVLHVPRLGRGIFQCSDGFSVRGLPMLSGEDVAPRRFVAERGMKFCARHLRLRNRYRGDGTVVAVARGSWGIGTGIGLRDRWEGRGFGGGHVVVRRLGGLEGRVMGLLQVRVDGSVCLNTFGIEEAKIRMYFGTRSERAGRN
jgi:hypothetical protein